MIRFRCILLLLIFLFDSGRSLNVGKRFINFDWKNRNFPKALVSGPLITRSAKRNFKLLFVLGLLGVETCEELYVRVPQQVLYGSSPRQLSSSEFVAGEDENLAIIFPGAGGPDTYTASLRNSIIDKDRKAGVKRRVLVYDWSPWRGPFVRAAFDGQAVGKIVGEQIALEDVKYKHEYVNNDLKSFGYDISKTNSKKSPKNSCKDFNCFKGLKNVDFIGISVGSFAADSAAKWFHYDTIERADNKNLPPVHTELILLDPFTSKGIFGYHWGISNFGMTLDSSKFLNLRFVNDPATDYFEVYLNTDDPVPSTSDPIPNANTFDITYEKSKSNFIPPQGESMHSWPVVYLAQNWQTKVDGTNILRLLPRSPNPRGVVEKL